MNCHTTTAKSEWRLTMANNRLTRKQRAAVVRRQKITLAAGIAVLILVIIFVLAFKGCNSKKRITTKQSRLILRLLLMTIKQQQKTTAKTENLRNFRMFPHHQITALIIQEASMLIRSLFHPKDFQSRLSME